MNETIQRQTEEICKLLYDKKAQDVVAIHVADKTIVADWFVVCSGRAVQQVKALCDELDEKTEALGLTLRRTEGYQEGRWIVMDYGDVLVHIFHPEERAFYDIERLWQDRDNATDYSALFAEREKNA